MFKHVPNIKLPELSSVTTDNGRFYTTPEGNVYPSVTTVLSASGDKTWLEEWKIRVGEDTVKKVSQQAATRGTAVHEITEKYLLNDPLYNKKCMPNNLMSFKQIKGFLDDHVGLIAGVELPLYSDVLKVAGRSDLIAKWDGIWSIIDFKTSKYNKEETDIENYFIQGSCYSKMFEERTGLKIPQIVIVMTIDFDQSKYFIKQSKDYIDKFVEIRKLYS